MNRQPKGTPVGGRFAEGRNPDGGDLTVPSDAPMDYFREFMKEAKAEVYDATENADHIISRYGSRDVILSPDAQEAYASLETAVAKQKEMIFELEAKIRDLEKPVEKPWVYISPDGNWGDAEGLLLLTRDEAMEVGSLDELYEEHGDDLIDVVRKRLQGETGVTDFNSSDDDDPKYTVTVRDGQPVKSWVTGGLVQSKVLLQQADFDSAADISYNEDSEELLVELENGTIVSVEPGDVSISEKTVTKPKPELFLQYIDQQDVVDAIVRVDSARADADDGDRGTDIGDAIERLNEFLFSPSESSPIMLTFNDPSELVGAITNLQDLWRESASFDADDDLMQELGSAIDGLGEFLTSLEPEEL